jgi:hypothetical protein
MSEEGVRAHAAEKRFGAATLDRWLALEADDREALLHLARELRLGENQFRDFFDQLSDVASRRGCAVASLVADGPVRDALRRGLSRNDAIHAVRQTLRRLRYPQLTAVEERLARLRMGLGLPAAVRLELPENLEGEQVTVVLQASSAAELRERARALAAAAQEGAVDEIFDLLAGVW